MFDGLLRFQMLEKWANLRFPLNIQKQKVFQLQGGEAPLTPDQGLCLWTPLGALPPDPRYRLALRSLAMHVLLTCSSVLTISLPRLFRVELCRRRQRCADPEFFLCPLQSADFDQGFASVRVRIE